MMYPTTFLFNNSHLSPCGHLAIMDTPIIRTAPKNILQTLDRNKFPLLRILTIKYTSKTRGPEDVRNKGSWLYNEKDKCCY